MAEFNPVTTPASNLAMIVVGIIGMACNKHDRIPIKSVIIIDILLENLSNNNPEPIAPITAPMGTKAFIKPR